MRLRRLPPRRSGVAAIEFGVVTVLFVVPLIIGVWEVGRLIQVQQIVSNAAREGARLAGQGFTILSDGTQIQIRSNSGPRSVQAIVVEYLRGSGLNIRPEDVTVQFQFTTPRTTQYIRIPGVDPPEANYGPGSFPPEPCYGEKAQQFIVRVSIPWERVRWINLGILQPDRVEYTAHWQMLIDDTFTVNTTLPAW